MPLQSFVTFIQRFPLFIYSAILVSHFVLFFSFEQQLQYQAALQLQQLQFFFFFILGLPFVLFFSFIYIIILTQQISQLLRCQFLISQNKIIKYETVTNMYFLVCSVCTFFFSIIDLCSFFLYIKARMYVQCFCTLHPMFLRCTSTMPFC